MTTTRSPKHQQRPGLPLIAATTAALPAVVLSSLALAQPASAAARPNSLPATLMASLRAQAATVPTAAPAVIPAAQVPAVFPSALRPATAPVPAEYTIARGDTISAIAGRYGLNTFALLELNNLRANTIIHPGQKIKLTANAGAPAPVAAAPVVATQAAPATGNAKVYTVRSGDTLGAIAARHGVRLAEVFEWNRLGMSSIIYPGQRITVGAAQAPAPAPAPAPTASTPAPAPAPAPVKATPAPAAPAQSTAARSYTIKSGDTLSGIAARNGVRLSDILSANKLSMSSIIYPGQKITLGGVATAPSAPAAPKPAAPAPAAPKPAAPAPAAPAAPGSYTIKSGDTLSGIAARNGVRLSDILSANQLSMSSIIFPGQKLVLPGASIAPSSSQPTAPSSAPLVPSTFLGFSYPAAVVESANQNKALLNASPVPTREQMKAIVADTARRMGVDPSLAMAFAFQESSFDHRSVSPANAIGTMQVIPMSGQWASDLVGRKLNLLDPYDNATAGVAIIKQLLATSKDLDHAIAGYYQGQYSVLRYGMYEDTKSYVASIKAHQRNYR